LKIDNDLKVMLEDFFFFDVNKISKLWLHLLYAHIKRFENISNNDFDSYNKYIFKNYTLRFDTLEHYQDIIKILQKKLSRKIDRQTDRQTDSNDKIKDDISKLMLNFLEDKPANVDYLKDTNLQDKLQSAIEFEYLKHNLEFKNLEFIIEIGAGYGRIPEYLINNKVKKTYIIIDIPPALYFSQKYLSHKFSNHKILKYNTKLTHQILKENLRSFDLIFLSLHQLIFLKNILPVEKTISICINALQEIPKDTILEIYKQLEEISKYSYIKSVNSNVNNPYKDELLNFDSILKILNQWNIISRNSYTFPSNYSEMILIRK
jgi:putative sugar O-methyltransferase